MMQRRRVHIRAYTCTRGFCLCVCVCLCSRRNMRSLAPHCHTHYSTYLLHSAQPLRTTPKPPGHAPSTRYPIYTNTNCMTSLQHICDVDAVNAARHRCASAVETPCLHWAKQQCVHCVNTLALFSGLVPESLSPYLSACVLRVSIHIFSVRYTAL